MNTKVIAVIVAAIVLLGLGGYLLLGKNSNPQTVTPTPTKTQSASDTLLNILQSGKTQKCTFSSSNESGTTKGTIYLSGTKMRADIANTSSKDNKTTNFYMIRDADTTYIWGDALSTGIKMTLSIKDLDDNTQANQYFDTKQKVDYSCDAWIADNSMFTIPTNIKFTDLSSMMMKETVTPSSTTPNATNACAGIKDPTTRASCENAMHQNGY